MNEGLEALERLTKIHNHNDFKECYKIIEKELKEYEQYKAIEQELGIDLITLFKAIRNGVFVKGQETQYPLALIRKHYSSGKTKYYVFHNGREKEIKLNNYGKNWALTKEELL